MSFWGQPVNVVAVPTNPTDNDISTVDTIRQMTSLVKSSVSSLPIVHVVDSILRTLNVKPSDKDIARGIWWWVKNHIKFEEDETILARELGYQKDPYQELLIAPPVLVMMPKPMGDCDDFSMLTATLLYAVGMKVGFKAIAVDRDMPWKWSHVYVMTYLPSEDRWMVMDNSFGLFPGWETERKKFREGLWLIN